MAKAKTIVTIILADSEGKKHYAKMKCRVSSFPASTQLGAIQGLDSDGAMCDLAEVLNDGLQNVD